MKTFENWCSECKFKKQQKFRHSKNTVKEYVTIYKNGFSKSLEVFTRKRTKYYLKKL